MKTVRSACVLHDKALDIRVSDQIEQLDELIREEGDGSAFFVKTHMTQGMRDLVSEGLARLDGKSAQAVFHLKQAMGGGKTHLLVGLGLLAKNEKLRAAECAKVGIDVGKGFKCARVAAFNGRNNPEHFFWGEIAAQIGKGDLFKAYWANGPKAPDEKAWLELFAGEEPTLVLLDEMPPYFHYYGTQSVGSGTVADIATRAFANLLTAAGKKKNVAVVISDLSASYDTGSNLIQRALQDAKNELGRQERTITPVDLTNNEVYDILRKRLFKKLPGKSEIDDIAAAYGKKITEAGKAKVANRGAEAIADDVASTYPFHPRLKNLVALFKENEQFKQTRGLMEIVSRLLRSVWDRKEDDVFLIGAQHFDLANTEVREKLAEVSGMRDVIAKDLWDANLSAHAQLVDQSLGKSAARQVASLLLTASMSTGVNAVKGLTREEMVECLVSPLADAEDFLSAFEELEKTAWYIHRTQDFRYYFDRVENLTKLLESLAKDAPSNQVDELVRNRLKEMFKPTRKTAYEEVLPLPRLDDVTDRVRKSRVLLVVSPDARMPPEEAARFFKSIAQKNNVCILTGEKTPIAKVETAARHHYAAQKADHRIAKGHAQREELERKQQAYDHEFTTTILAFFDKVLFPLHRAGKDAELKAKPLNKERDQNKPFNGEEQIEKTLNSDPGIKLYLDVDENFDAIREKVQDLLWPAGSDKARWTDVVDKASEQAGMCWLPPKGLEAVKATACSRGLWEDFGNGYVTKKPEKKKATVQVVSLSDPSDDGSVRIKVEPQDAGPQPRIHYAEDGQVSESSPKLEDRELTTKALRVRFLVVDPSGQHESAEPYVWSNSLVLRNKLNDGPKRTVQLLVAPQGTIRYTLDGSEPRNGTDYTSPIEIGDGDARIWVFAEAGGIEARQQFTFSAKGKKGLLIDPVKPAKVVAKRPLALDSRAKAYEGLAAAKERSITFEKVTISVGNGAQCVTVSIGEIPVDAAFIETLLSAVVAKVGPDAPITLRFGKANMKSGHDLQEFAAKLGIELQPNDVEQ